MDDQPVLMGALLEEACLTLEQLCGTCAVSSDWVASHVVEGRLRPPGDRPSQWRFGSRDVVRVRTIRRLEIAFEADPELAALVADLMEELANLRAQLPRSAAG
ncbi:MAG TPA: MerR family transcriptional regulator [Burkholderiaceae bacterium]|nr:MerR family transcriptional regulator [Burkholderiaceae bacterium]